MRKVLLPLVVVGVLVVPAPPASPADDTRQPKSRTVELHYDESSPYFRGCGSCPYTFAYRNDRWATVEVIDDVSPTGYVDIVWESRSDDDPGYFVVCGETSEPQRIPPNAELVGFPWAHPGPDCPTGFSTSGTIRITFTRSR